MVLINEGKGRVDGKNTRTSFSTLFLEDNKKKKVCVCNGSGAAGTNPEVDSGSPECVYKTII